jgi:arabinan endo-1,5-alpha-L-arabinosidase
MKSRNLSAAFYLLFFMMLSGWASAQVGEPYIHDPSTIAECDGKYYTFGTGGGGLISEDGWTWRRGAVRPGGGVAPDIIHIGAVLCDICKRGRGAIRRARKQCICNVDQDP